MLFRLKKNCTVNWLHNRILISSCTNSYFKYKFHNMYIGTACILIRWLQWNTEPITPTIGYYLEQWTIDIHSWNNEPITPTDGYYWNTEPITPTIGLLLEHWANYTHDCVILELTVNHSHPLLEQWTNYIHRWVLFGTVNHWHPQLEQWTNYTHRWVLLEHWTNYTHNWVTIGTLSQLHSRLRNIGINSEPFTSTIGTVNQLYPQMGTIGTVKHHIHSWIRYMCTLCICTTFHYNIIINEV